MPTICALCPVGCNVSATTREGKVKRILSRNHPEVDGGWLCDKGRFSYPHLYAPDRIREPLLRAPQRGLGPASWEEALDGAEQLLREGEGNIVTALSGSETVELAYALGRLLREGLGAHSAVLPESTSEALDAFRLPLAAIAAAELVVVIGDEEVAERAPIVELWLKEARRRGADVVTIGAAGGIPMPAGGGAAALQELVAPASELGQRVRASERAILIWSGPAGGGGARLAEAAHALGIESKPGSGAFHLPATPNARGVAEAWSCASDGDEANPEPIGLLVVSGDEAAADPSVRALAEQANAVIAITMFHGLAAGWADVILPATSYLERDGTLLNLEGRLQRLRRAVVPPVPDELAWVAELAGRFGIELSPHPLVVFDELAVRAFGGISVGAVGEQAPLLGRAPFSAPAPAPETRGPIARQTDEHFLGELRLVRYRPLFSGPQVERVAELQFQRPEPELELSSADAERRTIVSGDTVLVRSNGTALALRARVKRRLNEGVARVADEHAGDLHGLVEVVKA